MATVRPFMALRPLPEVAAKLACPPYDVISTQEARVLARGNNISFLRVTRAEVTLPESIDEHAREVHAQAKENLHSLEIEGALRADSANRMYIYEMGRAGHTQRGVVGCVSAEEYLRDIIRKHEKTRADKEDDRALHLELLGAHDEPVFLAYGARDDIDAVVSNVDARHPEYDFTASDGSTHRFWALSEPESLALAAAFERVPLLYVADGHHRSAAAARVFQKLKGAGHHPEAEFFPAVVFADRELRILAYNRLVRDTQGRTTDALVAAISERMDLTQVRAPEEAVPRVRGEFGLYLQGRTYRARARNVTASNPVDALDCSMCQRELLGPVFDVRDPRKDKHIDFVGGARPLSELTGRVDSGEFTLAVLMFPTSMADLMAVSDAGMLMPPKSTWFDPKPQSGLFVHKF